MRIERLALFIQTETTPNPLTLKFIPGRIVMDKGTYDFPLKETAHVSLLAQSLFAISGVEGVFYGADFISVTKSEDADWSVLKPSILGAIMEQFVSARPLFASEKAQDEAVDSDPIIAEIKEIIDTRVRPAVAMDGGDIIFDRFEEGVVYLRMQGACSGCPSSSVTLKNGIETMLRHYVPEVVEVRSVE